MNNTITPKELDYVIDSMSNEDLLMKQCTATSNAAAAPALKNLCEQMIKTHQDHYNQLLQCLEQHQQSSPTTPQ